MTYSRRLQPCCHLDGLDARGAAIRGQMQEGVGTRMSWTECIGADLQELGELVQQVQAAEVEALCDLILGAQRIFVVGQGRSGLIMKMFALRLMQLALTVFVVGDATTPAIHTGDLLMVCSASGETPGAVSPARRAREAGAQVAAIVARSESSLGQLAHHTVLIPGETPKVSMQQKSRLPLATVLEQATLVVLDCVVCSLAERMQQTNLAMMVRHANLE